MFARFSRILYPVVINARLKHGKFYEKWQKNFGCCFKLHVSIFLHFCTKRCLKKIQQFHDNEPFSDILENPNVKKPKAPVMFLKPTSSYIKEGQDIIVCYSIEFKRIILLRLLFHLDPRSVEFS